MAAAGKKADLIAARLVPEAVEPLVADAARLTLALDDTPTKRHGPRVQEAGVHHNPTPGPRPDRRSSTASSSWSWGSWPHIRPGA